LLVAACGGPKPQAPNKAAQPGPPDTSNIEINGDASEAVNKLAMQAIADLQDYWGKEFPELYDKVYEPVKGGFYAVIPSSGDVPACAQDASEISGNAFYCARKDVVAWDAEDLLPTLQKKHGDFVIPVVLAHEWGHAIQGRSNFTARTVTKELQADCFAGAWAKHAKDDKVFDVTAADQGAAQGGDSPYDSIVNGVPYDIEDYFTQVYPELADGQKWPPLRSIEPYGPGNAPMCGDQSADGYALFYCVADDYVGWDNAVGMPRQRHPLQPPGHQHLPHLAGRP
jgi:predicted metalloprotease